MITVIVRMVVICGEGEGYIWDGAYRKSSGSGKVLFLNLGGGYKSVCFIIIH